VYGSTLFNARGNPMRAQQAAGVRAEFHRYHGAGHGLQDFTNDERFRAPQSEHARQEPLTLLGDRLG